MKTLHQFASLEEAQMAVAFLEQCEIQAHIWDENVAGLYPMFNPNFGMIRVAVAEDDWEQAEKMLETYLESIR